jgi:putative transposase
MTESSPEEKPNPLSDAYQTRELVGERNYGPHIRRIGEEEEKLDDAGENRYAAKRWVVERTLGWFSKCRAVSVRYEKKGANYLEG